MIRSALGKILTALAGSEARLMRQHSAGEPAGAGVWILSPGDLPTTGVYLLARLREHGGLRIIDTRNERTDGQAPAPEGTTLVVVRHAPSDWLVWLRRNRGRLAHVSLLMDDDMPAALQARELPLSYAWRTAFRHASTRRGLRGLCDGVWLSTPELCARYARWTPGLCRPLYVEGPEWTNATDPALPVYFYHGTRAHRAEIEWLVPVVREVQSRHPLAVFEVSGDASIARLFHGIPRVRVLPPMPWTSFLALRARPGSAYRVGLAPCLPTPFNAARSPVKLFDITRLGAAGIYADRAPYRTAVRDGETGLLCVDSPAEWARSILGLLDDKPRVVAIAQAARLLARADRAANMGWPPRQGSVS